MKSCPGRHSKISSTACIRRNWDFISPTEDTKGKDQFSSKESVASSSKEKPQVTAQNRW